MYKNKDYSFLSKILHHLALGSNFIPEMLHDIEVFFFKKKIKIDNSKPHIFVSGLPRSGTTILMRFLYETDQFASLTYRDMPFVVLPNIWSKISNKIKSNLKKERIHGDNISINIDSPEALEEIFWRVKLQKNYIYSNKLVLHKADEFTINEFQSFVSLILQKYKKSIYLSKNNNNILRLESIIHAYSNCLILIPFRDPLQQAYSLLSQHEKFIKIHKDDKFIRQYMTYLVHHEFGEIHRPYQFGDHENLKFNNRSLDYWLVQWIKTYHYLSQEKFINSKNIMFINFDLLCSDPKKILKIIFEKINIKDFHFNSNHEFQLPYRDVKSFNKELFQKASEIHKKLLELSSII